MIIRLAPCLYPTPLRRLPSPRLHCRLLSSTKDKVAGGAQFHDLTVPNQSRHHNGDQAARRPRILRMLDLRSLIWRFGENCMMFTASHHTQKDVFSHVPY